MKKSGANTEVVWNHGSGDDRNEGGAVGGRDGEVAFPIVALGASAGGLEALEAFFRKVPEDSGMAYVEVQHLDPKHQAMLTELLQRRAEIPVCDGRASDIRIIPDRTKESMIDGLVVTFLDVSEARKLAVELEECRARLQAVATKPDESEGGSA